ncbi:peptidase [Lentibacillus cibarius]|uniref:Peptidase n=1 Tax=Lentibacillus cibarius TaxID=2583219 RepID=A0A549YMH2_9BACI|nr:C40 family peptidase [Lentibacillus cibarius]TRM13080.1 peptidase [Lentibacillus cibarius]
MLKRIIGVATSVVLAGGLIFAAPAGAETLHGVQKERSVVKANLSDTEEKIADAMEELKDLNDKIKSVNEALEKNRQKMRETKNKISEAKEEIPALEAEVNKLEKKIEKRKEVMKSRIVSLQKSGGDVSFLDVIFGAESFSDLITRVSAVSKIAKSDRQLVEQQETDKANLKEKKEKIENKLKELQSMKVEIKGMEQTILAQKEQNEADKKKLQTKKEHLQGLKNELQNKDRSLASIERELRRRESSGGKSTAPLSRSGLKQLSSSVDNSDKQQRSTSSGSLSAAINAGYTQMGTPYVTAGKGPGGFDCSGFVSWAFGQADISIPSSTAALQNTGKRISYSDAKPGDLVFFNTYKTNGHVGIYLGNGKFLGAQTSTGVDVASMSNTYWKKHFAGHVRRVR